MADRETHELLGEISDKLGRIAYTLEGLYNTLAPPGDTTVEEVEALREQAGRRQEGLDLDAVPGTSPPSAASWRWAHPRRCPACTDGRVKVVEEREAQPGRLSCDTCDAEWLWIQWANHGAGAWVPVQALPKHDGPSPTCCAFQVLTSVQLADVERQAAVEGVSAAEVVRNCIDLALRPPPGRPMTELTETPHEEAS